MKDLSLLWTIGFAQKSAETFFGLLRFSGTKRLIDVRLNNDSQLCGFAKRADLPYFLRELCQIEYLHVPDFAPTKRLLDRYKKYKGDWQAYAEGYLELLELRRVENLLKREQLNGSCLLCSEHLPHQCHRRLLAQYLNEKLGDTIRVQHLA
jgi:uncharacterized protein (DUF488 family)